MTPLIALPAPMLPEFNTGSAGAEHPLPDLPALDRLLHTGRPLPESPDWRSGVFALLSGSREHFAPVAVAARALQSVPAATPLCFAAPVHVVAGISRVHMPPGGRLSLDPHEQETWRIVFNQELGSDAVKLHAAEPGGDWLLQAPFAAAALDGAPELLAGEVLERRTAQDADERHLRRFGAEAEMWLAAHALNRERESRRDPPVNALWLWGGGLAAPLPPVSGLGAVLVHGAADAWMGGLARHAGVSCLAVTGWRDAESLMQQQATDSRAVLIVLAPEGGVASQSFWNMVEEAWMAPAEAALRSGAIPGLQLQIGPRAWQVPDRSPARWLRWRRRSWWSLAGMVRA